jgi:hypothetical protein
MIGGAPNLLFVAGQANDRSALATLRSSAVPAPALAPRARANGPRRRRHSWRRSDQPSLLPADPSLVPQRPDDLHARGLAGREERSQDAEDQAGRDRRQNTGEREGIGHLEDAASVQSLDEDVAQI